MHSVHDRRAGHLIPIKVISSKRVHGWPGEGIALIIPHRLGDGLTRGLPWQSGTVKRHFPLPEETKKKSLGIQRPQEEEQSQEVTFIEKSGPLPPDLEGAEGFIIVTSDRASIGEKNTNRSSNEIIYQISEDDRVHVVNSVPRRDPLYFPLIRPWIKAGCLPYYIRNAIRSGQRKGRRNLTIAVLSDEDMNYFDKFYVDESRRPIARSPSTGRTVNPRTRQEETVRPVDLIQLAFDEEFDGKTGCRIRAPRHKDVGDVLVNLGLLELWERNKALKEHNPDNANRNRWRIHNANTVSIGYKKALASYWNRLKATDPVMLGVDQETDPVRYAMLMEKKLELDDDWDFLMFKRFIIKGPRDNSRPRIGSTREEERSVATRQLQKILTIDEEGNLSFNQDSRWVLSLKSDTVDPATIASQVGRKVTFGVVAQWLDFLGISAPIVQEGVMTRMQKEAQEEAEERRMRQEALDPFFRDDDEED